MFSGESTHTLDKKNRVFVPKRFQDVLERDAAGNAVVILTRGFDGCLFLFSDKGFEAVRARLDLMPFGGAEQRKMQRLFFANTHRCQLDASGRLVLPEKLRKSAGIENEVVMVGVSERAEIWDRARWEAFEGENEGDFDDLDFVLVGGSARSARADASADASLDSGANGGPPAGA